MIQSNPRGLWLGLCLALTVCAPVAHAAGTFPKLTVWAYPGRFQDVAHTVFPYTTVCAGLTPTQLPDSVREDRRMVTVRFIRDRVAEAREDFGGYRIYRVTNTPDSTRMQLLRRYSVQEGDEVLWHMSRVNPTTLQFQCGNTVVHDSIATFVDPDSAGNIIKACPNLDTRTNRCLSDSVFRLVPPPGPHDGFVTYYAITYELLNTGLEGTYEEMFVPDLAETIRPCGVTYDPDSCANLNHKLANVSNGVTPSSGSRPDLETVRVVPNPFRAREEWDINGANDLHFVNLPDKARIRIYTLSGDLVRELEHDGRPVGSDLTNVRNYRNWDLKNASGRDVSSGIYMYRVESDAFAYQGRFVVIR